MPKKPFDEELDTPRRSSMSDETIRSASSSDLDEDALDYDDEDDAEDDII